MRETLTSGSRCQGINQDKAKALRQSQMKWRATDLHHLSPKRHSLTLPADLAIKNSFEIIFAFSAFRPSLIILRGPQPKNQGILADIVIVAG